jgi:hypothetical protein
LLDATLGSSEPRPDQFLRPGVALVGCTTGFLFAKGKQLFLATAAHCVATDTSMSCNSSRPIGSSITIKPGDQRPNVEGFLAYSSWDSMNRAGVKDDALCYQNDFALIGIPDALRGAAHPRPLGGLDAPTHVGDCRDYGGSIAVPALVPVKGFGRSGSAYVVTDQPVGRQGYFLHPNGGQPPHTCTVRFDVPTIPGDSGGPLMGPDGAALGVLQSGTIAPEPGSDEYMNLAMALDLMQHYAGWKPQLVV